MGEEGAVVFRFEVSGEAETVVDCKAFFGGIGDEAPEGGTVGKFIINLLPKN